MRLLAMTCALGRAEPTKGYSPLRVCHLITVAHEGAIAGLTPQSEEHLLLPPMDCFSTELVHASRRVVCVCEPAL